MVDFSDVAEGPRAVVSRSERLAVYTTADVKRRLGALAAERGWTLSKVAHLALIAGVQALEEEARVTRVSVQDAMKGQDER